jgi:hypothetical protein
MKKKFEDEVKDLISLSKRLGIPEYLMSLTTEEIMLLALIVLRIHMKDNVESIKLDINDGE